MIRHSRLPLPDNLYAVCYTLDGFYGAKKSPEKILALKEELNTAKKEIEKHCQENDALKCEAIAIRAEAEVKINELKRSAAEQIALIKFGLERFSNDDDAIKFYTGFPTYTHLKSFFEFARQKAQYMTYCYASGGRESRPESRCMQLIDELFMFLIRLRLGLFEQDIADRFQLHMSTVSRKIIT